MRKIILRLENRISKYNKHGFRTIVVSYTFTRYRGGVASLDLMIKMITGNDVDTVHPGH